MLHLPMRFSAAGMFCTERVANLCDEGSICQSRGALAESTTVAERLTLCMTSNPVPLTGVLRLSINQACNAVRMQLKPFCSQHASSVAPCACWHIWHVRDA